jgi:hypothetical protein
MVHVPPPPRLVVRPQGSSSGPRRLLLGLLWLASVLAAAAAGAHFAAPLMSSTQAQLSALDASADEQAEELEAVRARVAGAERDAQVAQATNRELQDTLRERAQEIAALRADLGFYQRLVGGSERRTLGVHTLSLRALDDAARAFAFELTLTQNLKKSALTEGSAQIAVEGVRDGQVVTVPWRQLSGRADGEPLGFSFKYFQRIEGTLALPESLVPNRILVSATSRGGERAEQAFAWDEALAAKEESADAGP